MNNKEFDSTVELIGDTPVIGVEYDKLPTTLTETPDIFELIYNYFRENLVEFKKLIIRECCAINNVKKSLKKCNKEIEDVFNIFINILKHLPQPFIPSDLVDIHSRYLCQQSATSCLVSLPNSKRNFLQRFITLLCECQSDSMFPLNFDKLIGFSFVQGCSYSLFSILTRQNNNYLCFPILEFKSLSRFAITDGNSDNLMLTHLREEKQRVYIDSKISELKRRFEKNALNIGVTEDISKTLTKLSKEEAEKLKSQLKNLIIDFEKKLRELSSDKVPKEVIKKYYIIYDDIKQYISRSPTYIKLLEQKNKLQIELNQFRDDFEKKYGRKLQTSDDKKPVREKYDLYKQVKKKIEKYEKAKV